MEFGPCPRKLAATGCSRSSVVGMFQTECGIRLISTLNLAGGGHWGSSHELLGAIYRAKPKAGGQRTVGPVVPEDVKG